MALKVDAKKYFDRLGEMAAVTGTCEHTLKSGKTVRVRGLSDAVEATVRSAIPKPTMPTKPGKKEGERVPDPTDTEYQGYLEMRNSVIKAGLVACAIEGMTLGDKSKATYENPGGGERGEGRRKWIREAAIEISQSFHADDVAEILAIADRLGRGDSVEDLADEAGKGSARTSTKSKTSDSPEARAS